ncbi:RTX toxin [Archangium gephyra]|uniref:RTX toxin n=1 Tax=Archangium gephyra TaxID=48 RepID=A0AAC8TDJ5_9BACT|nr:RTX toxin [Archangium gephyra]
MEPGFTCWGEPSRCEFTEVEPNDTPETASAAGLARWMRGSIRTSTDVDVYRITLNSTVDLRLDTFDGSGMERCNDLDTVVELLGADGVLIASDDDSGLNGCSSVDPAHDQGARSLAPGIYYVRVSSYSSSIPAYVLRLQYPALCGNGQREGSEMCDDGNLSNTDACGAYCRPTGTPETEPNDSAATSNGLFTLPMTVKGAIGSGSDQDVFRFTIPATADVRLELFDGSGRASCADIDTLLELVAPDATTSLATNDDGGLELCSALLPQAEPNARRLAPGTYYARVTSYGDVIPGYILMARFEALCGDGRVSGSEECDGTAGCSATCERIPFCGDGLLDYPEFCDDSNTANGDGCSNVCKGEGLQSEVEPNNTRADASARAGEATPVLINGSKRLSGAFPRSDDVDLYRMDVSAPSLVRFDTFHGGFNRCDSGLGTELRLMDSTGVTLVSDTVSGMGNCSALASYLQPGIYYVQTKAWDYYGPEAYALDAVFQSSAGSEAEPNNTPAAANSVSGVDFFVAGSLATGTDEDYYRLTVPAGASIRAEIVEGGTQSCDGLELDSELSLFDASGELLSANDDAGRGYCSRIDGRGESPDNWGASELTAGTYYLRVRAAPRAEDSATVFSYRLSVTLR